MDEKEAKIAALEEELRRLKAQPAAVDTGGGPATGDVNIEEGDFVGRDKIVAALGDRAVHIKGDARGLVLVTGDGNTVTIAVDQLPPDVLLKSYYRALAQECRRLPLGVVDPRFAQPSQEGEVSLAAVYTDLDVVATVRAEDEQEKRWGLRLARGEGSERTPLLEAISEANATRLVLIGDPGSGKTTFVNYLSYRLAEAVVSGDDSALSEVLRKLLPVRLILRSVARDIADEHAGKAGLLWDALRADVTERLGAAAAERLFPYLQERLLKDGCLLLLDGLDEVPEAAQRRRCLLDAIQGLAGALPSGARVMLTARPYAYADPRWQLPGFEVLALAPFRREQVEGFIERWHQAVRPALGWDAATVEDRTRVLSEALFQRAYLADLASRPLLLTLMATLHSSWGQLPEDRAELYEESVKLLLSRWQKSREVKGTDGKPILEPGIARALDLGEDAIRGALENLAFQAHQAQSGRDERVEAPADIAYGDVLAVFTPLLPEDCSPKVLINYLDHRAGLLIGRREGVYAFPHRSFQEYLAACHLANNEPEFAAKLRDLVWQDLTWWREVFLLGAGKKRQGGLGDAVNVVNTLVPASPLETSDIEPIHWQAAVLGGQALLEMRLPQKAGGQTHYEAIQKRIRFWLRRLVEEGRLSPRERLVAGDVLGYLGDPRPGVGVVADKGLPEIDWIEVPAGSFVMGSRDDDEQAMDREKPVHNVELATFHISRYPVTNAQYRVFMEAGGYEEKDWWTEEGWAWRQNYQRDQPRFWDRLDWGAPNRPVIGVSWYEAVAYSRWLDSLFRSTSQFGVLLESGYHVCLSTEAQWEKAARGPNGNRWPWGDVWDDTRANTGETGLKQTSPVGLFQDGASFYGIQDMAGNVWEWTSSRWGKDMFEEPDYGYPYDPAGTDCRVLRGGSWSDQVGAARCAYRNDYEPVTVLNYVGFRVVVSLVSDF